MQHSILDTHIADVAVHLSCHHHHLASSFLAVLAEVSLFVRRLGGDSWVDESSGEPDDVEVDQDDDQQEEEGSAAFPVLELEDGDEGDGVDDEEGEEEKEV